MIHEERIAALQGLQENLGYVFRDGELLGHALVHRSFANECACAPIKDNERLEFLGDAVLDLCVSDLLMRHFPNDSEGRLSKRRAACVNERTLAEIAKRFRLGEYLLLGKGEELSGGRSKPSLLADAFEAVVAAIYMDGGFENASAFVQRLFTDLVEKGLQDILYKDYKTLLQETSQVRFREAPKYSVVQESGGPRQDVRGSPRCIRSCHHDWFGKEPQGSGAGGCKKGPGIPGPSAGRWKAPRRGRPFIERHAAHHSRLHHEPGCPHRCIFCNESITAGCHPSPFSRMPLPGPSGIISAVSKREEPSALARTRCRWPLWR